MVGDKILVSFICKDMSLFGELSKSDIANMMPSGDTLYHTSIDYLGESDKIPDWLNPDQVSNIKTPKNEGCCVLFSDVNYRGRTYEACLDGKSSYKKEL